MHSSKGDIETEIDIVQLIDAFYSVVKEDAIIGYIFNEHMQLSFEEHMPIMYSFWQSVLLNTASYKGNVMLSHIHLNKKTPLKEEHFDRWILLWEQAVDNSFEGALAEEAKKRARLMKELMMHKIKHSNNPGFIQ